MSLQSMIAYVVVPLVLSAAAMTYAAATNTRFIAVIAAASFAVAVLIVAGKVNKRYWRAGAEPHAADSLFHTMRRNIRLAALTYAWAAAAFYSVYGLSGLTWRHGFQYGTLASLIAAVLLAYVHRMGQPPHDHPPHRYLTIAHGYAIVAGLVFLVLSGKLASLRGDWAANLIFLFGGLALAGLITMAIRTQRVLEQPGAMQASREAPPPA